MGSESFDLDLVWNYKLFKCRICSAGHATINWRISCMQINSFKTFTYVEIRIFSSSQLEHLLLQIYKTPHFPHTFVRLHHYLKIMITYIELTQKSRVLLLVDGWDVTARKKVYTFNIALFMFCGVFFQTSFNIYMYKHLIRWRIRFSFCLFYPKTES